MRGYPTRAEGVEENNTLGHQAKEALNLEWDNRDTVQAGEGRNSSGRKGRWGRTQGHEKVFR